VLATPLLEPGPDQVDVELEVVELLHVLERQPRAARDLTFDDVKVLDLAVEVVGRQRLEAKLEIAQRPVPPPDAPPHVTVEQGHADDGDRHQHRHNGKQDDDEPIHDSCHPEWQDAFEPGRPVTQVMPGVLAQRELEARACRERALTLEEPAAIVDLAGHTQQHADEIG